MSQEQQVNYVQTYEANFDFVQTQPIEAVFEVNPNISDLYYTHYQDVPQSKWVINHNLGKCPSVIIATSAGEVVTADIQYKNLNTVEIQFAGAFAGVAHLN